VNLERLALEGPNGYFELFPDADTPCSPVVAGRARQPKLVRLEDVVWGHETMLGGQDEPRATAGLGVATFLSEERRRVQILGG